MSSRAKLGCLASHEDDGTQPTGSKLNGDDQHAYRTDVIGKIVNGHSNSRIDELLPWASPAAHAPKDVA